MAISSSQSKQFRKQSSKLSVAALAYALLALVIAGSHGMPNSATDCMKNPFATGCRGISAKRSALVQGIVWPPEVSQQQQRQQVSLYDIVTATMAASQSDKQQVNRVRQQAYYGLAVDFLMEAASRLAAAGGGNGAPPRAVIETRSLRGEKREGPDLRGRVREEPMD